jgi:hypothetical protein
MGRGTVRRAAVVLGLALALAAPADAGAQEAVAVDRGARVRVWTFLQEAVAVDRGARVRVWTFLPDVPPIEGEFERWTGSELLLYQGERSRTIDIDDIDILEVSEGRSFNTTGAIVGGVLGAAAGGALACATVNRDDYGVFCGGQSDTEVVVGAVLGAAAGAALGGLLFRVERWVPVPLLGLIGRP